MADIKISELPVASVVNNNDIVVLNQGTTTKTATKELVVAGLATTGQLSGLATTSQLSGFATTSQISGFTNTAQVSAIASAQIAAITPASIGALSTEEASGFATTAQISGFATTEQLGGYATTTDIQGIAFTSQLSGFATTGQISGFTNSAQVQAIASAQIAAITPASIGAASTAQLSAYVPKTGATMEGKLIMAATTAQAFANIGGLLPGVAAPASTVGGDIWVSNQSRLTFSPSTGVAVALAGTSQQNTFNQTQTIGVGGTVTSLVVSNNGTGRAATFVAASASAALSILQTGAGEALRVEDETSPDATAFVISSTGRVGIGVAPDAVTALSVDSGGIKFADGSIATTALGGAGGLSSSQVQAITSAQISAITPGSIGAVATSDIIAISHGGTGSTDAISALSALGAAGLSSPAFTGTPTAPTAAANTNTTQLATTEFVISNRGDSYLTTSTSTNTVSNGTKTFTVEAGLSYTPTQDCTIVFNSSNHMHGVVVTYSGTTLVVDVTQHTGSGSYSVWTINVGGLTTAAGALLSANNLSDVANTATALTNIGGVSTARSVSAGTGLTGGGDLTANRTLSIAALSPDPTGTYGSTSQIPSLTVNNLGQVTAASSLAMPSTSTQVFTSSGTWTKPAGAKAVHIIAVGGGGGGGSGRASASGTAAGGGGGGGSGGRSFITINADLLGATETVTIGAGNAGGVARTVGNDGLPGVTGGFTSFGLWLSAGGGTGGLGGTTLTGGNGGSGATRALFIGGNGGLASSTFVTGTNGGNGSGAGGGGAGGGVTAGNVASTASFGGFAFQYNGAAQTNTPVGQAGASVPANSPYGGNGGGGGNASVSAIAMSGGAGGTYGGGGGGGGASQGFDSGAGGAGASGIVVVTTYF